MSHVSQADVPALESLFIDAEALPSPPVTVLDVVRRSDDPDVSLEELARLIELDVGLAVQILRMANSALYSPVSEITTIERALTTLGLRSVRLLALSASLRTLVPDQVDSFDTAEIRRRMVVSGSLSRRFAQRLARAEEHEAFLGGLLTGLGPIVLATSARSVCERLVEESGSWPTAAVERDFLGYTTDDITVSLMRQWGLPKALCEAIERRNDAPSPDDPPLLTCLRLSLLAEEVLCGPNPGAALGPLLEATSSELDMSSEETEEWLVGAEPMVAATADLLQFKFPQTQAFSELLLEATMHMQQLAMETNTAIVEGSRQLEVLTERNVQLKRAASTDALTQLPNRGLFDEMLEKRVAECQRAGGGGRTLGLLLIDLDHFKTVNDTFGHTVGDDLLRSIGAILQTQTRGDDMPARYGGDEFVVLLPGTNRNELQIVGDRLLARLGELRVGPQTDEGIDATVSIGGALFGEVSDDTGAELIRRADRRMYDAKRNGRNQLDLG